MATWGKRGPGRISGAPELLKQYSEGLTAAGGLALERASG
jgi:hypothetical protein